MLSAAWEGDWSITQPWGRTDLTVEPLWGAIHWHCGVDVGMPVWTRLFAARAGKIAYIGSGLLAIEVGTQVDWYVHIESAQVALGATVRHGDFVAFSGARVPSGGSLTGPHLHFEVQTSPLARVGYYDANGRWIQPAGSLNYPPTSVDPIPVLKGTFGPSGGSLGGLDVATADEIMAELNIIHQGIFGKDPAVLTPPIQDRLKSVADQVDLVHQGLFGQDPAVLSPPIQDGIARLLARPTPAGLVDLSPILAALADLKAHPAVINDPGLASAIADVHAQLVAGLRVNLEGTAKP